LLGAVGRQFPNVNFELFDAVAQDHLWIRPEHKDRILKKYFPTDPSEPCRVHLSTAFDFLEDGSITIKEYVTTLVKTLEVRKTQNEVAGELVRWLDKSLYEAVRGQTYRVFNKSNLRDLKIAVRHGAALHLTPIV
jgi:hypothetical protein